MLWNELARFALLGTEHHALTEEFLVKLDAEGLNTSQAEPILLAEASALYSQLKKAGFVLQKFGGELPKKLHLQEEPSCSLRSAEHLRLILDGKFGPALPEFMSHLLENGLCLPTVHLPTLLSRKDLHEWWHLLEPALGHRGRWLLGQHPQWRKLIEETDDLDWETGSFEERVRLLGHLRKQNPRSAVELLESTWDTENHRSKTAFLGEMTIGLSSAVDEDFLEKCRNDRRKEVRMKAIELLGKLPDSNFSERMFDRAIACLNWSRSKLKVELPEEPDEEAVADGILKINLDWKGGAKAGYLGQVVSAVPPSLWELTWDREPNDILNQFEKTNWADTLGLALSTAAVRFEDATWTEVLIHHWFHDEESLLWNESVGGQLLETASSETINSLALDFLSEEKGLPEEDSPLFQLLVQNDSPWSAELSGEIVERFRAWLRQTKKPDWTSFHYKELLKMLSYRCPVGFYEKLKSGLDNRLPLWPFWEKNIDELVETVFFRRAMILELEGV